MLSNKGCCGHSPNSLLFNLSIHVYVSISHGCEVNLIAHELRDGENAVRSPQTSVPPACQSHLLTVCSPSPVTPADLFSPTLLPSTSNPDLFTVLTSSLLPEMKSARSGGSPRVGCTAGLQAQSLSSRPPIGSLLQAHSVFLQHLSLTLLLSCTRAVTFLDKALPSDSKNKEWPSPLRHHTSILG